MSFEIFVQAFRNCDSSRFPREIVEEEFGPFVSKRETGFIELRFDSVNGADIYISDEPDVDGFMVSRPPIVEQFWTALIRILKRAQAVLFWNGAAFVTDLDVAGHLPREFIASIGAPRLVERPRDITKFLVSSND